MIICWDRVFTKKTRDQYSNSNCLKEFYLHQIIVGISFLEFFPHCAFVGSNPFEFYLH